MKFAFNDPVCTRFIMVNNTGILVRKLLIIAGFFVLSGCDHLEEDKDATVKVVTDDADQVATNIENRGVSIADNVRDHAKMTGEQLRKWWITPLPAKPGPKAVASSYCYKVLQDILCYSQPMPGWEYRLVAYQGSGAAAPPRPVTEPLPKRVVNPNVLPENRVANAKPVFTSLPPAPKEEEKNTDQPAMLDPTHEQLPNPIASPQL